MKRNVVRRTFPLLLALCLLLTACGAASGSTDASASESMTSDNGYGIYQETPQAAADMATEDTITEAETDEGAAAGNAYTQSQVKLIYTAYLELEVLDFDAAAEDLDRQVEEAGGYCESSNLYHYGNYRSAEYVIRVPSDKFQAFVDTCSAWENCYLRNRNIEVDDVGAEYFDAETRLATLRTKMERLQALLAQATEMEDIITIESAISETEYQIEQYTSTLNRYDSLIDYSTVQICLTEVVDLTEDEGTGLLTRLGQNLCWGAKDFLSGLEDLILWLAYNIIGLLVLVIGVTVIVLAVHKFKNRRKGKKLYTNTEKKKDSTDSESQEK